MLRMKVMRRWKRRRKSINLVISKEEDLELDLLKDVQNPSVDPLKEEDVEAVLVQEERGHL